MRTKAQPRVHTESLSIRLSLSALRSLVQRAQAERRTLSDFVRLRLESSSEMESKTRGLTR
jgi:uncharacterized protein (DUF1778 family)